MNREALKAVTKARAALIIDAPFFGTLAIRLALAEDSTEPTFCTDGRTLRYNPDFALSLSTDELRAVLAHEVMHNACCHHTRRNGRDPVQWNEAADYAINSQLIAAGFRLPDGALIDQAYDDLSAEEIYARRSARPQPNGNDPQPQPGQGDKADPGRCGRVADAPAGNEPDQAAGEAERAQIEAETKVAVQQAVRAAKKAGRLPASLERFAADILQPTIPWREVLRQYVDQAAKNDYTWTRPNRRHMAAGLYLPGMYSEELGPIVIAVDTSGSIAQRQLDMMAAEVNDIAATAQISTVHVVYCDARIQKVEQYTGDDFPIRLQSHVGGGTDFRPVFDYADQLPEQPALLVYLTDGYGRAPHHAPSYPVLWTITPEGDNSCPWGEAVEITE